ncbi:MAG: ATP-binding cassette domain-containing protein [Hyphomicrobium sp.]|nr:ATP-binding cassette domain-containing protein [Hyphomicrobium sp.]
MLRIENLKVGELEPISVEIADGECLAVEAPSGGGKTRLLRAIADLDAADGHIFLDGAERKEMPAPSWRKIVRYVAAEPGWWTDTARPTFPAETLARTRLQRLLSSVGLDEGHLDRPLAQLSTGERQRLAFVRALSDEPRVLLLDEPTSALDPGRTALVEEAVRFHLLQGRIAILSTHDLALAGRLRNKRLVLPSLSERGTQGIAGGAP